MWTGPCCSWTDTRSHMTSRPTGEGELKPALWNALLRSRIEFGCVRVPAATAESRWNEQLFPWAVRSHGDVLHLVNYWATPRLLSIFCRFGKRLASVLCSYLRNRALDNPSQQWVPGPFQILGDHDRNRATRTSRVKLKGRNAVWKGFSTKVFSSSGSERMRWSNLVKLSAVFVVDSFVIYENLELMISIQINLILIYSPRIISGNL